MPVPVIRSLFARRLRSSRNAGLAACPATGTAALGQGRPLEGPGHALGGEPRAAAWAGGRAAGDVAAALRTDHVCVRLSRDDLRWVGCSAPSANLLDAVHM